MGFGKSMFTSGNPTAENTNFVERSQGVDLGKAANMNHCVLTEGGSPYEMVNRFAID